MRAYGDGGPRLTPPDLRTAPRVRGAGQADSATGAVTSRHLALPHFLSRPVARQNVRRQGHSNQSLSGRTAALFPKTSGHSFTRRRRQERICCRLMGLPRTITLWRVLSDPPATAPARSGTRTSLSPPSPVAFSPTSFLVRPLLPRHSQPCANYDPRRLNERLGRLLPRTSSNATVTLTSGYRRLGFFKEHAK